MSLQSRKFIYNIEKFIIQSQRMRTDLLYKDQPLTI